MPVYNHFQLAKKYFHYYVTAANGKGHGVHSPFVFDFVLSVLNNRHRYSAPSNIEALRTGLFNDKRSITVEDLGAGSRLHSAKEKNISQIAKSAVKPKKYGQLLYRLVKHYQPPTIIELGTSLGITTAYLAAANAKSTVITIEGSEAISAIAQTNFKQLGLHNVQSLTGNFDLLLPQVLLPMPSIDMAYIDGNHRLQPTLDYFHQLLSKTHNDTILIFDDIHWSKEMEEAWHHIQQHPSVTLSIDLFFIGIIFFRQEQKVQQHFVIRF